MEDRWHVVVQIDQRVEHGVSPPYEFVSRDNTTTLERAREILAFDVLHDQYWCVFVDEVVDDHYEGRVTKRGKQPCLVFERAIGFTAA